MSFFDNPFHRPSFFRPPQDRGRAGFEWNANGPDAMSRAPWGRLNRLSNQAVRSQGAEDGYDFRADMGARYAGAMTGAGPMGLWTAFATDQQVYAAGRELELAGDEAMFDNPGFKAALDRAAASLYARSNPFDWVNAPRLSTEETNDAIRALIDLRAADALNGTTDEAARLALHSLLKDSVGNDAPLSSMVLMSAQGFEAPRIDDKYLARHGGYERNDNGTISITKGEWAGHTLVPVGKEGNDTLYDVLDENMEMVGQWASPKGEKIASPLVVDLDGDGIETTGIEDGRAFDLDADGRVDRTAWAGADDGVLAFDRDGNGEIDDGSELFGNYTDLDGKGGADGFANGFDALRAFAEQHLGYVGDRLDADQIRTLEETANLRIMVGGELKKPSDVGVTGLDLGYEETDHVDAHGNEHRQIGNGITDVWFKYLAG